MFLTQRRLFAFEYIDIIMLRVGEKIMNKKANHSKIANLTLGGMTLGLLLSYPFHPSFVGGLITSGCSAGLIGGLADWFAVTALFRRPLGIRPGKVLRTEIIPQNRERIFAALADMVQHELLSQEVLRRKLSAWDFSGVLIRIFREKDVRETVSGLLSNLLEDNISDLELAEFKGRLLGLLQANLEGPELSETLAEIIQFSVEHGDVDRVIEAICLVMYDFMDQPEVSSTLSDMMGDALSRYGEKNPTRKIVEMFLPNSFVLAQGVQEKAKTALRDGTVQQWIKRYLLRFVLELRTSPMLQERVNRFFLRALEVGLENSPVIERLLVNLRNNWDVYLKGFDQNLALRQRVDDGVRGFLEKQIGYHHNAIGRMVREGLEPLTDDKLVELIEAKAGNDLQMIRINGSVVGGMAGMLIYLLGVVLS